MKFKDTMHIRMRNEYDDFPYKPWADGDEYIQELGKDIKAFKEKMQRNIAIFNPSDRVKFCLMISYLDDYQKHIEGKVDEYKKNNKGNKETS